jgi:hypothetical protein
MLTVVTYLWNIENGIYTPDDVFKLRAMVRNNLSIEHQFAVLTDSPEVFEYTDMHAVQVDTRFRRNAKATHNKLMLFHPHADELLGERVLGIDLDCIITAPIDDLIRDDALILWRNPRRRPFDDPLSRQPFYNSSLVLATTGQFCYLWDEECMGQKGDGQWISWRMGPYVPYWDQSHGVWRPQTYNLPPGAGCTDKPDNVKIMFFPGSRKPLHPEVQEICPWINEYLEINRIEPDSWVSQLD